MAASLVQIDSYGCAINKVASDATAIPQRSSRMKLQYQTYWDNDAQVGGPYDKEQQDQEAGHLQWIRDIYTAIYKQSGGLARAANVDGCYYNLLRQRSGNV